MTYIGYHGAVKLLGYSAKFLTGNRNHRRVDIQAGL